MEDYRIFLQSLEKSGIRFGLEAVSALAGRLGNPQDSYRSVLIAGTNGKGSTAAMLASLLTAAGLKVGLYTSPHLSDFRERIRVGGGLIGDDELVALTNETQARLAEQVTYFEFTTVLAFQYFRDRAVDVAVLETGMGGRLDATNLVTPELSIITNVSMEHREYLGKNLKQIAFEKAGIIKRNGICITGARQQPALAVIEEQCRLKGSRLHVLGRDMAVRAVGEGCMNYRGLGLALKNLRPPLLGRHQMDNAALALAAVEVLAAKGLPVTEDSIRLGLERTAWEGRVEVLRRSPLLVVDGAHNPAGVESLLRAIERHFRYEKLIFIFGALKDKDHRAMLAKIRRAADMIILTRPPTDRGAPPGMFAAGLANTLVEELPSRALERALAAAGPRDLVCAAGSLYLVAEIRELAKQLP